MENENLMESTESTETLQEEVVSTEVSVSDPESTSEISTEETENIEQSSVEDIAVFSGSSLTADDVKDAVLSALDEWQDTEFGEFVVGYYAPGMERPLEKFTLTEICLVILVLIALAGGIMKIIGGRAHE